jgi:hypothetical protein
MPFITQDKTNWKFLLIVIILAIIVGGGALWYVKRLEQPYQPFEVKKPETANEEKDIVQSITSPNNHFIEWQSEKNHNYAFIITNLLTKEQREFDSSVLLSDDIASYINEYDKLVKEGKRTYTYTGIMPGEWSPDSKYFWGFVYSFTSTGPSIVEAASVFKINMENWQIEKFPIPRPGNFINYLSLEALNLEKQTILFEQSINGGIALYLYNLQSEKEETIVSYPKEVLDEYYSGYFWIYVNGSPEEGNPRQLNPKWINTDTISYIDLRTEKEMAKKID